MPAHCIDALEWLSMHVALVGHNVFAILEGEGGLIIPSSVILVLNYVLGLLADLLH